MAKTCPDCGFSNDDAKLFCGACGEPIAGDAKIVRDMQRLNEKKKREAEAKANAPKVAPVQRKEDYDYVAPRLAKQNDNTDAWLIGLALFAFLVFCFCGWYVVINWNTFF